MTTLAHESLRGVQPKPMGNNKLIQFNYLGPSESEVFLVGDFNAWLKRRMTERVVDETSLRSNYYCSLELPPGRHQYKFIVNGEYILDPMNLLT